MKNKILTLVLIVISLVGHSQSTKWIVDDTHAKIGFKVTHFGISETEGKFTKFSGTVHSDKSDFSHSKIEFVADVNSVY